MPTPTPFQWPININPNPTAPPRIKFDPNPLTNVRIGDEIFWINNDTEAHWPGRLNNDGSIDKTFFMANPIAPGTSSDPFSPGVAGELKYACSLSGHEKETGSIQVTK
ncbi:MAG TPA: hypothetical protein VG488_01725 [Candidatus Angelobacter sp.]|jgi:plastocyanin|nr:hypothetical protein [Candidatus Angelobacter sp.]